MKSVLLCRPHCAHSSHRWGGMREGWQMRPHLDRPHILPALTPVARDAPRLSATIKGCLPTVATKTASPISPHCLITTSKIGKIKHTQSSIHTLAPESGHNVLINVFLRVDGQSLCWCTRPLWCYWRTLTFSTSTRNQWQVCTLAG